MTPCGQSELGAGRKGEGAMEGAGARTGDGRGTAGGSMAAGTLLALPGMCLGCRWPRHQAFQPQMGLRGDQ